MANPFEFNGETLFDADGITTGDIAVGVADMDDTDRDDALVKIIGYTTERGEGQKRTRNDGSVYDASDQVILYFEIVDDRFEEGSTSREWVNLPRTKRDGSGRRKPHVNSRLGKWLSLWEDMGVSGDPARAFCFELEDYSDFVGLTYYRKVSEQQMSNGSTTTCAAPLSIAEMDNELRARMGLREIEVTPSPHQYQPPE